MIYSRTKFDDAFSINVLIDDDNYYFDNTDYSVYQACLINGIYLPRFCYHNKLKIAGNCRICLVEDPKSPKPIASCAVLISKDQAIYTKTSLVKQSQEGVIEYLLINHPLDCPICDQGGECDLQDQTMIYGSDKGRYYEPYKRAVENTNYGPLIKFVLNRCIHCARCTRFFTDIAGLDTLTFINRGYSSQISSYIQSYLNSEISGNVIDLCPVGALTSKPYSFTTRVWEMSYIKYVDVFDSFNSTIRVDIRGLDIMRILPYINEDLNEEWITDNIRFFYDAINVQRLLNPTFFYKNKKIYMGWLKTVKLIKLFFIKNLYFFINKKIRNANFTIKAGSFIDAESVIFLKNFFFKFNFSYFNNNNNKLDFRHNYLSSNNLSKIHLYKHFLLNNINIRYESPIFNIKIKNLIDTYDDINIYVLGFLSNFNYFVKHLGTNSNKINLYSNKMLVVCGSNMLQLNPFKEALYIHKSHVDVALMEFSFFKNLKISNNFYNSYSLNYDINWDLLNNLFVFSKYNLNIYQGQHGDIGSKLSNVILPTKLFFEKSSYYINTFGWVQNMKSFYFDYGFKKTKYDSDIIVMLSGIFSKTFNTNIFSNIFTNKAVLDLSFYDIFIYNNKSNHINNNIIKSKVNNFYTSNSIIKMSKTLSTCSKLYTIINDFIFLTYSNII